MLEGYRRFKMYKRLIFKITFIFFVSYVSILSAKELQVELHPTPDQPNNIRNYLMHVSSDITHHSLDGIDSLRDWKKVRNKRYEDFLEMMGLVDVPIKGKRPPLNVTVTGTVQCKGYHIENLYYESLPHLYVPANLYVPDKITSPVPGILYVCGHVPDQKVTYQTHARKFAELGFVCLIIETIQWGEVRGEHWGCWDRGWFNWYSRGYNPGGVELWNGIRGLDLLSERKEVDAGKLGVTGISGGGSQSWYIAAADSRIKAAAAVCGAGTLEAQIYQRTIDGHCDCMMPINTYLRDFHDIGALIAPRPFLIAQADRDNLYSIESVRQCYEYTKKIYDLYNASDNLILVETPGGHSYHEISRTKIFSFFIKHLMEKDVSPEDVGDIDESKESQLSAEVLQVYKNGAPADDRTKTIQDSFISLAKPPVINNKYEFKKYRKEVVSFLKEKTFRAFPRRPCKLDIKLEMRCLPGNKNVYRYSFVPERGWRLPFALHQCKKPDTKHPLLLVLENPYEKTFKERHWKRWWCRKEITEGLSNDWDIAYFEIRGIGETAWGSELKWHIRRASAWTGRTIASMRVYDVLRCLETLRSIKGVDKKHISIAAKGEMSVIALYAALLDGDICSVILQDPLEMQDIPGDKDGRGEAVEMLNCLRITDVPQAAGLLWPAQLVFIGKPPKTYNWAIELYKRMGTTDKVMILKNISEL